MAESKLFSMESKTVDEQVSIDQDLGQVCEYATGTPGQHSTQLHRTFKARHIQMICLGGCIGSGLFISTGKALRLGGPGGMLIGYSLICSMALAVLNVMSEATCIWPTSGNFIDHAARFVDPALGFAVGFSEWFAWMTVIASEGAVFSIILSYWTTAIPTAACMTIYLVLIFAIHSLPNKWFAEFEFGTAAAKIVVMFIILFASIAMIAGAGPTGSRNHGEGWSSLSAFPNGAKGVFATFTYAAWATGGQEIMGITAGESQMPRWDMPRACKNLVIRIVLFYELSIIFISILVPYTDPLLLGTSNIAASPFVIAMVHAGIKGLPDILNVIMLVGLCAIGAESLYISSRVATAMSRMGMAPAFLGRVDKQGRPYMALLFTGALSTICTYINCANTGAVIFTWFSSISATVYFMTWMAIAITNVCMHRAIKVQGDPAFSLPYAFRKRFFPSWSIYLFITSFMVLFGTGWVSLFPVGADTSIEAFFETFLGVPIFICAYIGYKLIYRTKFVPPQAADLQSGRRPLTPQDIEFLDKYYAQPMYKRILSYVTF